MPKAIASLVLLLALCTACGAQRATPPSQPAGEPLCLVSTVSPTIAPTPNAPQRATMQAAPTVEPGLQGFVIDFVLAVSRGDDTRARMNYLAPGLYRDVASLQRELGLPNPAAGCGLTISPQPIEATANRVVIETTIQTDTQAVTRRLTLERTSTYWRITAIR